MAEERLVRISVTDDGDGWHGQHPDELTRRFAPRLRGRRFLRRRFGLGLALVREIAETHGGLFMLTDAAGRGARPELSHCPTVAVALTGPGSQDVQACHRAAYSPSSARSSSWLPISVIRPSITTAIRSASWAVCSRWAMATTVRSVSSAFIDPSR